MKAEYFYDRLRRYKDEESTSGKSYLGYDHGMVAIHHSGDESTRYTIFSNGRVCQRRLEDQSGKLLSIAELAGDDYELFSGIQVVKSGYLVLKNADSIDFVENILMELLQYIKHLKGNDMVGAADRIPDICCQNAVQENRVGSFFYGYPMGVEVQLQTVKSFCKENVSRKYYGAKCIPFDTSMNAKNAIHVNFLTVIKDLTRVTDRKKCSMALEDLLQFLESLGVEAEWAECEMKKPVYL